MSKLLWCSTCRSLLNDMKGHESCNTSMLGEDNDKTILSLDEIIQYGLESLQKMEADVENARKVKKEFESMRETFTESLRTRIEKIVKDLRVALDDQAMVLMGDVENKICDMEARAQEVIKKSTPKLDTAKQFIQKAATVLPDDNGNFNESQLKDLQNYYKTLEKANQQPAPEVNSVDVNIKYPNSMKMKTECAALAKQIIGEIENTKRPSLLNAQRPSIDMENVKDFGV